MRIAAGWYNEPLAVFTSLEHVYEAFPEIFGKFGSEDFVAADLDDMEEAVNAESRFTFVLYRLEDYNRDGAVIEQHKTDTMLTVKVRFNAPPHFNDEDKEQWRDANKADAAMLVHRCVSPWTVAYLETEVED